MREQIFFEFYQYHDNKKVKNIPSISKVRPFTVFIVENKTHRYNLRSFIIYILFNQKNYFQAHLQRKNESEKNINIV